MIQLEKTPFIFTSDIEIFKTNNGFSLYEGVIVFWDEHYDRRILSLIDFIKKLKNSDKLLAAQESKGIVNLLWRSFIPSNFEDMPDYEIENDYLIINSFFTQNNDWEILNPKIIPSENIFLYKENKCHTQEIKQ